MTNTYTPPTGPAAMLVAAAAQRPGTLRDIVCQYAARLTAEGAFAGLAAADARVVTSVIAFDILHADDGAGLLHRRAALIENGSWAGWRAPAAAALAFRIAANVLDEL